MASFVSELWESVFTPGTNGALLVATHASFVLLLTLLAALTWYSGSIHFFNLLVIASVLYGLVIWFIGELRQAKLKTNDELKRESEETKDKTEDKDNTEKDKQTVSNPQGKTSAVGGVSATKRKV